MIRSAACFAAIVVIAGCAAKQGGNLTAESLGSEAALLRAPTATAIYSHGRAPETSFFLSDAPAPALLDEPGLTAQVVHIELLWEPKPGRTPLDPAATNASIRHVVIVGNEVGIYAGAGFAILHSKPGKEVLRVTVRDSSLRLVESTPGFVDRLGPARLSGWFTARLDDSACRQLRYAVSQRVTDALGRTRLVDRSQIETLLAMLREE